MKLWQGRLGGDVDERLDRLNKSIGFDARMYKQDIEGSMAHAAMLGAKGIIPQSEAGEIVDALDGILSDLESGALEFDMAAEDIHMFVEQVLTERLGDAGRRLHTARSRNDQVALDFKMYVKKEIREIIDGVYRGPDAPAAGTSTVAATDEVLDEKTAAARLKELEAKMAEHAKNLDFEKAAQVREAWKALRAKVFGASVDA